MKEINLFCGQDIRSAIELLINAGEGHYFNFNGVKIYFNSNLSIDDYVKQHEDILKWNRFVKSFDVKSEKEQLLLKISNYFNMLETFNHDASEKDYLSWIASYVLLSDDASVTHLNKNSQILLSLEKKGYIANELVGSSEVDSLENKIKWCIGQIMGGMEDGCVHPRLALMLQEYIKEL